MKADPRVKKAPTSITQRLASMTRQTDNLPLVQFIYKEVTEGKIIDPTVRVYIDKGLWIRSSRSIQTALLQGRKTGEQRD